MDGYAAGSVHAVAVEGRVVVVVVAVVALIVVVVVVVEESAAFELHYLNEHDLSTAYYWRALYYEKDSYYEQIPLSSGSPVLVTNNEHTQ